MRIYGNELFDIEENMTCFQYDMQTDFELHKHKFIEIAYIVEGEVFHSITGLDNMSKMQKLTKGHYVIVDYGVAHQFKQVNKNSVTIMNCIFKPQLLDATLKDDSSFKKILSNYLILYDCMIENDYSLIFYDQHGEVISVLGKIHEELKGMKNGSIQLIRAYLIEVIIMTMRYYEDYHEIRYKDKSTFETSYVLKYIKNNYHKRIQLDDFTSVLNLSPGHISHMFHKQTGITFSKYIQTVRMNNACRILCNTDESVCEIAKMVGYNDYKHFNDTFKKYFFTSPLQYRKMNRSMHLK